MVMTLNTTITDNDIVHRTTVANHVLLRYKQERHMLQQKLEVIPFPNATITDLTP